MKEYVSRFEIVVNDIRFVQIFDRIYHLFYDDFGLSLIEASCLFEIGSQVRAGAILHDQAYLISL